MAHGDEQWQLFGGAPGPEKPEKTDEPEEIRPSEEPELRPPDALTVTAFNERVAGFLKGVFPGKFLIQGFVSGFGRSWSRGSHVYFDLVERDPGDDSRTLSQISMVIWRGVRNRLRRDLEALGDPARDLDDQQVYFEVSVNYYVPRGRISLIVEGVDVDASLGARKLDRDRILRMLAAEGLVDANAARPLPAVPLRLALITSVESAAYHDFIKELGLAGVAFRLGCIDARVQGSEQEAELAAAFATVNRRAKEFDAVVLIRGGGSRSDLAGFDAERLARDIAACPLPVLTGIGHEIDRSIADEMAHGAFKTPTAVAQFLAQRVEDWLTAMDEKAAAVRLAGERRLTLERRRLDTAAHALRGGTQRHLGRARTRLGDPAARLPVLARQLLRLRKMELLHRTRQLSPPRLGALMGRERVLLSRHMSRLAVTARDFIERRRRHLDHRADGLRLLDPRRVLARGFSLTRDEGGRLLTDTRGLAPGARIVTQLASGELESELRAVKPESEGERPQ